MRSTGGGIQKLLATLAKHSDLVAEAFDGPIGTGDRARDAAIAELTAVDALKPYDEGTYYLCSGLHDYFSVVLSSFHAFQSLTRISGIVRQAGGQWDELRTLKRAGAHKDMRRLEMALQRSVIEVGDVVERNIALLNTMVLGQYGNVDNLKSKLRQNTYYSVEVQTCLRELRLVEAFVERVSDSSLAEGLSDVRRLVQRRLGAQLFPWSSRLKDAQAVISRRLFEAKLMERRQRQLARYASWLASNRTTEGWDIAVDEAVDPVLFGPSMLMLRPQPDVADSSNANIDRLVEAAHRLPREKTLALPLPTLDATTLVLSDEMEPLSLVLEPHELALGLLRIQLTSTLAEVSLRTWRAENPALDDLSDEVWLHYAADSLRDGAFMLRFIWNGHVDPFPINEPFYDIRVSLLPPGGA